MRRISPRPPACIATGRKFDPQNAQAWFSLGNALVATRDYAEALAAYDTAMARGETGDRLLVVRAGALMGLALAGTRPLADAIAAFEAVADATPPVPAVFLSLGKLHDKVGEPALALAAFRRFLEVAPPDHEQRAFASGEVARLTPMTNERPEKADRWSFCVNSAEQIARPASDDCSHLVALRLAVLPLPQ